MDRKTKNQSIRAMAIEVGEVHAQQLEAWEATRSQALALAEALYSSSGLEPHVPPEQWGWWNGAAAIADFGVDGAVLGRLVEACDDILSRMLQPQQGGDALVRGEIGAVRSILISASNFKPGMSIMGRLTELVEGFITKDEVKEPEACEATITGIDTYVCSLPRGHAGSHSGESGGRNVSILRQRNGKPGIQTEIDARIEFVNVDDLPDVGFRLIVTVCGDKVASAEASNEFLDRSSLEFELDRVHIHEELALALLDHMRGTGKHVTILSWKETNGNGLMLARVLTRKNSDLTAHFVYYDFSDGTTGPESVPEYVRDSFRRTIHEATAKGIQGGGAES